MSINSALSLSLVYTCLIQDMKKESEKSDGAQEEGFGASKTAEVKPVSSIAVKRKAEEDGSSNKKLAREKETAAAS